MTQYMTPHTIRPRSTASRWSERDLRARLYREELSRLAPGASLDDVRRAEAAADERMSAMGLRTGEQRQASADLEGLSGAMRLGMQFSRGIQGGVRLASRALDYTPAGLLQSAVGMDSPSEMMDPLFRRTDAITDAISASGDAGLADTVAYAAGAVFDPANYIGYGAGVKAIQAARAAAGLRPVSGLAGRVAQEAALGAAVETPLAAARGEDNPLLAGGIGGVVGGALPVVGAGFRKALGKQQPWDAASNLSKSDIEEAGLMEAADQSRARYSEQAYEQYAYDDITNKGILRSELDARKADAAATDPLTPQRRAREIVPDEVIQESKAIRQAEQDEALGKMGAELYGVRKAAGDQAERLNKANDIDVDVPSEQVAKFQRRAAQTAKLRGEAVPETPSVRPEVEADVAARQVDDAVREEALKDPDNFQAVQDFQADHGLSRQEAEDFVIHGAVPESWGGAPKQAAADVPVVKTRDAPSVGAKKPWQVTRSEFEASSLPQVEAAELVASRRAGDARSKNAGKRFAEREVPPMAEARVDIDDLPDGMVQYMRESTDASRVRQYAGQDVDTPITLRTNSKGQIVMDDGGHRLLAAIERGDTEINALVDVAAHESIVRSAARKGKPVPDSVLKDYPDIAPTGASGQQLDMGFQSGPFNPEQLDRLILSGLEGGKWAAHHTMAGARWALETAGDAIRTMRDFAEVVINKFGRAIRKHIPEMWQRFKKFQAQKSEFRQRTARLRAKGAIDPRSNKGVPKTKANAIRSSERAEMRRKASVREREIESLRGRADKIVNDKLGRRSVDGAAMARKASQIKTEAGYNKVVAEVDQRLEKLAQRKAVANSKDAIQKTLGKSKSSGIPGYLAFNDKDLAGYVDDIKAFGIENPRNPTRQELGAMSDFERSELEKTYQQMVNAYTHKRKYGARPYAEGANPLKDKRNFVNESWGRSVLRGLQVGREALNTAIDPVADYIQRYSPRLLGRLRRYATDHLMERHRYRQRIDPLLTSARKAIRKFGPDAERRLDSALFRGDADEVMRIADAMGDKGAAVREMWEESRAILKELYDKARAAGIDVGYLENYWPRLVKRGRADDLTTFFSGRPTNEMTRALKAHADAKGYGSVSDIPDAERLQIIESVSKGRGPRGTDGGRIGNLKHRSIGDIPDEAMQFYEPFYTSMDAYIDRVTESIARKNLFGGDVPLGRAGSDDPFSLNDAARIESVDDLGDTIGKILDEDGVPPEKVGDTLEVIRTLFNSNSTSVGAVTANLRAFGYLATMGQLRSALAQLEDLASTAVFMPHEIPHMITATVRSILGKTEASTVRIGVERMGEEFAGRRGADKAVDFVFKTTGLSLIDRKIKNVTLETALIGGQKAASKPGSKAHARLKKNLTEMWGDEGAAKLMDDLAEGNFSDEVATYLHHKLSSIQPTTSLDVPLGYHYMKQVGGKSAWAGAPVLTYQLKTFFLRRLGALRREGVTGVVRGVEMMKNGDKSGGLKQILKSTRTLTAMAATLTAAGATRQQVVGYLYGNENDLSYDVGDAMLSLTGLNRYAAEQLQRGGGSFYSAVLAPPAGTTALDVITDGFRMADGKAPRTIKRLPHIQTLDIFTRGGFSESLKSSPSKEAGEDAGGIRGVGSVREVSKL